MVTVVTFTSTTAVRITISRVLYLIRFLSHEPFTRHYRIFLWQAFSRDYPTS